MTRLKGIFAGLAAVLFMLASAYRSGANRERNKAEAQRLAEHAESQGRRLEALRKTQEIQNEINRLPADDLAHRLRRWTRPGD